MRARIPRPYVMRGTALPLRARATIDDPRDPRVIAPRSRTLTPAQVHLLTRPGVTDPRFRPADRLLQRWAATHGSGPVPPSLAAVSLVTHTPETVPALDDRESLLIDAAVYSSKAWARTFVVLWYRTECSVQEMADALCIRRRQAVYEYRHGVLAYYLGRFEQMGLPVTFWVEV